MERTVIIFGGGEKITEKRRYQLNARRVTHLDELLVAFIVDRSLGLRRDRLNCAHKCVSKLPDTSKRPKHCQQVEEDTKPLFLRVRARARVGEIGLVRRV